MSAPQDSDDWLVTEVSSVKTLLDNAFAGRPFERVVSFPGGPPSWDCEMIAVWVRAIQHKGPETAPSTRTITTAGVVNTLVIGVDFLRCTTALTDDGVPEEAVVNDEGDDLLRDQWIAWRTLTRALVDGTVFDGCSVRRMQPLLPFQPSGGYTGFRLTIEVTV